MRICVTGGAGYIGSALVPLLDDCHVVENFGGGDPHNLPDGFLDYTPDQYRNATYEDCETVIHLAATVGESQCERTPVQASNNNVTDLVILLRKLAAMDKPPHFIFASSLVVYGDGPSPFVEDYRHYPLNLYAVTKSMGEHLVRLSGLPYTILRFANIYGLGKICRPDSLTGRFARCVAKGEPLPIWGDGSQKVDMVHVRDVARACKHFAEERRTGPYGDVFNIGSGVAMSVQDVADVFSLAGQKKLNRESVLRWTRKDYTVPHDRTVRIDAATQVGWKAKESMLAAATELVQYALDKA